jgi:hypothetical protein
VLPQSALGIVCSSPDEHIMRRFIPKNRSTEAPPYDHPLEDPGWADEVHDTEPEVPAYEEHIKDPGWGKRTDSRTPSRPNTVNNYKRLHELREAFLADHLSNRFPQAPCSVPICNKDTCMTSEFGNGCHHFLRAILKESGQYSVDFLRKERLKWHPDKFSGKGDGPVRATEIFEMIQRLIEEYE